MAHFSFGRVNIRCVFVEGSAAMPERARKCSRRCGPSVAGGKPVRVQGMRCFEAGHATPAKADRRTLRCTLRLCCGSFATFPARWPDVRSCPSFRYQATLQLPTLVPGHAAGSAHRPAPPRGSRPFVVRRPALPAEPVGENGHTPSLCDAGGAQQQGTWRECSEDRRQGQQDRAR
jgi:hypothetical protein